MAFRLCGFHCAGCTCRLPASVKRIASQTKSKKEGSSLLEPAYSYVEPGPRLWRRLHHGQAGAIDDGSGAMQVSVPAKGWEERPYPPGKCIRRGLASNMSLTGFDKRTKHQQTANPLLKRRSKLLVVARPKQPL